MPTAAPPHPPIPTVHLDILPNVSIASPCGARWEDMVGDEKVRHCSLCAMNVSNLSAMTREEAEEFVARARRADGSGRTCIRFFRRADGTILTRDCPRGLAAARARLARVAGRIAAVVGFAGLAAAGAAVAGSRGAGRTPVRNSAAVQWIINRLNPSASNAQVMGKMCIGEMSLPAPTVNPPNPTNAPTPPGATPCPPSSPDSP